MRNKLNNVKKIVSYISIIIGVILIFGTVNSVDLDIISIREMLVYWLCGALMILAGLIGKGGLSREN